MHDAYSSFDTTQCKDHPQLHETVFIANSTYETHESPVLPGQIPPAWPVMGAGKFEEQRSVREALGRSSSSTHQLGPLGLYVLFLVPLFMTIGTMLVVLLIFDVWWILIPMIGLVLCFISIAFNMINNGVSVVTSDRSSDDSSVSS
ncbi:hypothetical protein HOLleu_18436 [Holothuria leucospilota]|uniref:Uncharacterized protein n=1 Tax=Holothuria leucospilota TaxID=206669 RepID=A0A9Q1H6P3_HOLLE|nr:hypothetical protein HOLleu_18436 [Holothuria leucospilota]